MIIIPLRQHQPDFFLCLLQRAAGDPVCTVCAHCHEVFQVFLFTDETVELVTDRLQPVRHGLSYCHLESAISLAFEFLFDFGDALAGHDGVDRDQVVDTVLASRYTISVSESVTARLNLLRITGRSSRMLMKLFGLGSDFDILLVGSCRLMTFAPAFG